ncbi:hypothetical protein Vafri_8519 [Volvox africanus]|nr:hypothetical protein Vafri_8519 [Volvox africanus]
MTGADLGAVLSEAQLHAINENVEEATAREADRATATANAAAVADAAVAGGGGAAAGSAAAVAGASAAQMAYGDSSAAGGRSASGEAAQGSRSTSTAGGDNGSGSSGSGGSGSESSNGVAGGNGMAVSTGPQICMRHVLRALSAARPSLPAAEAARLAALYDRFRRDREAPVTRPGPGGADPGVKRATLA